MYTSQRSCKIKCSEMHKAISPVSDHSRQSMDAASILVTYLVIKKLIVYGSVNIGGTYICSP